MNQNNTQNVGEIVLRHFDALIKNSKSIDDAIDSFKYLINFIYNDDFLDSTKGKIRFSDMEYNDQMVLRSICKLADAGIEKMQPGYKNELLNQGCPGLNEYLNTLNNNNPDNTNTNSINLDKSIIRHFNTMTNEIDVMLANFNHLNSRGISSRFIHMVNFVYNGKKIEVPGRGINFLYDDLNDTTKMTLKSIIKLVDAKIEAVWNNYKEELLEDSPEIKPYLDEMGIVYNHDEPDNANNGIDNEIYNYFDELVNEIQMLLGNSSNMQNLPEIYQRFAFFTSFIYDGKKMKNSATNVVIGFDDLQEKTQNDLKSLHDFADATIEQAVPNFKQDLLNSHPEMQSYLDAIENDLGNPNGPNSDGSDDDLDDPEEEETKGKKKRKKKHSRKFKLIRKVLVVGGIAVGLVVAVKSCGSSKNDSSESYEYMMDSETPDPYDNDSYSSSSSYSETTSTQVATPTPKPIDDLPANEFIVAYFNNASDMIDGFLETRSSKDMNEIYTRFVNLTGFIYSGDTIRDVRYSDLPDDVKQQVVQIHSNIDANIESKVPGYKDALSSRYSQVKDYLGRSNGNSNVSQTQTNTTSQTQSNTQTTTQYNSQNSSGNVTESTTSQSPSNIQTPDDYAIGYVNTADSRIDALLANIDEKGVKEELYARFINITDFVFCGGEIGGVKFSDLTAETQQKLVQLIGSIDAKIDSKIPGYKESLKGRYSQIKTYMENSETLQNLKDSYNTTKEELKNKVDETVGHENTVDEFLDGVKDDATDVKDMAESAKDAISENYEEWSSKHR